MKHTTIALVVQNCLAGELKSNLDTCMDYSAKAADEGASIALFPEMNLTGYCSGKELPNIAVPLSETICTKLSKTAETKNIILVAGLAHLETMENRHRIFASQIVVFPDGRILIYKKIHAAPPEKEHLCTGDQIPRFNAASGITFGIQLCYDAHFPELSTRMAMDGVDLIMMPHASPRGTSQEKFDSWMRHLRARAFDNSVFIAAVNQTGSNGRGLDFPGVAAVLGPDGNIISKSLTKSETLIVTKLDARQLESVRNHRMKYFLPHRRGDLYFS